MHFNPAVKELPHDRHGDLTTMRPIFSPADHLTQQFTGIDRSRGSANQLNSELEGWRVIVHPGGGLQPLVSVRSVQNFSINLGYRPGDEGLGGLAAGG